MSEQLKRQVQSESPLAQPRDQVVRYGAGGVMLLVAVIIFVFVVIKPVHVLPVIDQAPQYELIDQDGNAFTSEQLHGRVVMYDFVYTRCTDACPAMTSEMMRLALYLDEQDMLGDEVVLVSMTFDPGRDTLERFAEYREMLNIEGFDGWYWVTGEPANIKRTVGADFGVFFDRVEVEGQPGYEFAHESTFVLVDPDGQIRMEYRFLEGMNRSTRHINWLLAEENAPFWLQPVYRISHSFGFYSS